MLADKIQDVFNEPSCAVNAAKTNKERKKGCSRSLKPGAAAGGCAFDGAKITLQPITDVAHLVHGPIACEGNSWENRNTGTSGPTLYRRGFTTDMTELDIIHGGEKKLLAAIKEVILKHDPPAVFVYQTCVPALIGDDVEAVCEHAAKTLGRPVVAINVPGFVGSKSLGAKLAGEALVDHVVGTEEPVHTTSTDVNIIGEYNVVGEFNLVRPLLDKLGIRVAAMISGDGRYHDIARCHRSRVNMIVCSQAIVNVGRKMRERWGIPYFEGSFYGVRDTSDTLREMCRLLVERGGPTDLIPRCEALIAEEEARVERRLIPYRERLRGKRVLLNTGGVKSWSLVSALESAGLTVIGTSVKKTTRLDRDKLRERKGEEFHMWDDLKQRDMWNLLRNREADIMLSGARTQFIALKAKMPWMDVNQEKHLPYAGYDGLLIMVEEIDRLLSSPIWPQVWAPAPWDQPTTDKERRP